MSNSGKYSWSIIDKDFNWRKCKIKVQSRTDKDVFDVSNGLFLVASTQSVNIITPNDGDILYRGTSTFIYWDNIDKNINSVDIFYSLDEGKKWVLIKGKVANVGKYNWAVPSDISSTNRCLIKINASNNKRLVDYSDQPFIIK